MELTAATPSCPGFMQRSKQFWTSDLKAKAVAVPLGCQVDWSVDFGDESGV